MKYDAPEDLWNQTCVVKITQNLLKKSLREYNPVFLLLFPVKFRFFRHVFKVFALL